MYLMNFKKGSQITKDKLQSENKKSLKILTTLPLNLLTPLALYWSYSCLQSGPQHWANGSPAMGVLGCGDEQEISNR